jgi:hypothetical protein
MRYEVTLGEVVWTAGHCHKCAHMSLTVPVEADSKSSAVAQVRDELCGTEHTVELDGCTAVLTITPDSALFTARSVKFHEEY